MVYFGNQNCVHLVWIRLNIEHFKATWKAVQEYRVYYTEHYRGYFKECQEGYCRGYYREYCKAFYNGSAVPVCYSVYCRQKCRWYSRGSTQVSGDEITMGTTYSTTNQIVEGTTQVTADRIEQDTKQGTAYRISQGTTYSTSDKIVEGTADGTTQVTKERIAQGTAQGTEKGTAQGTVNEMVDGTASTQSIGSEKTTCRQVDTLPNSQSIQVDTSPQVGTSTGSIQRYSLTARFHSAMRMRA